MASLFAFFAAMACGIGLTWIVRLYALKQGVIDRPSGRSSHDSPTPRGGGLSILVIFLIASAYLFETGDLLPNQFAVLFIAATMIGGVGFLDDHAHVAQLHRFTIQVLASVAAVWLVGGLPPLLFSNEMIDLGWFGLTLAAIFLVWLTNLFNFMDGIDGITALETIFIALAAVVLGSAANFISNLLLVLAGATAGFLVWNWPPAKVFMGDVGSAFIGFTLGVVALFSVNSDHLPLWTWLILAGVFIVDATVTVIRRMMRGAAWYQAHRSHAYQRMARRQSSHKKVTVGVLLINLVWILPIATLATQRPEFGWWLTIAAWLPLAVAAVLLGAGLPDDQ